jgi:hypothetical protein
VVDPDHLETLDAKRDRNREQRLEAVKAWAHYVRDQPVAVLGPQQNRLINSQLEPALHSDIDIELRLRVERAKPDRRPE